MKKNKDYELTKFSTDVIKKSLEKLRGLAGDQEIKFFDMSAKLNGEEWSHDNFEEFLSDYRNSDEAGIWVQTKNYSHRIRALLHESKSSHTHPLINNIY